MSALYRIEDVSLNLGAHKSWAGQAGLGINILAGITLDVGQGEVLGIVGESGSGKTTLARAMLGLINISGGALFFDEQKLDGLKPFKALRRKSAMLFQDSVGSLSPRMTVASLVTEPLIIQGEAVPDRTARAHALLELVGLPTSLAPRYPHELSGGQARRVCLARALALKPKLLIADEPTAGLDVSVQGEILNLLLRLKAELGMSLVIISHNLALMRHVTDRIAVLYLGRLVEAGPTSNVFAHPRHPYTQSLIASEPQPDPRKRRANLALQGEIPSVLARPSGCAFHTRCQIARDNCKVDAPRISHFDGNHTAQCHYT